MLKNDENEFWGCRRKTTDDDDGFHRDAFEWFCNCAESSESARERDYRCGRSFNERNIGDDKRVGDLTERVPRDERRTKSNSDDEFKAGRREDYEREKDLGNALRFEVGYANAKAEDEVTVNALVYFCQDDDVCLSRNVSFRAKVVDGGGDSSSSSSSAVDLTYSIPTPEPEISFAVPQFE